MGLIFARNGGQFHPNVAYVAKIEGWDGAGAATVELAWSHEDGWGYTVCPEETQPYDSLPPEWQGDDYPSPARRESIKPGTLQANRANGEIVVERGTAAAAAVGATLA